MRNGFADLAAIGTGIVVTVFVGSWVSILPTLGLLWLMGFLK